MKIKIGKYSQNEALLQKLGLGKFLAYPGFCVRAGDCFALLYNDNLHPDMARFTVAHELGHILLEHLAPYSKSNRRIEREANVFALLLLLMGYRKPQSHKSEQGS